MVSFRPVLSRVLLVAILILVSQPATAQINDLWTAAATSGDSSSGDNAVDMAVDSDGNVYVTGRGMFNHGPGPALDYVTVKFLSNGVVDWIRSYSDNDDVDTSQVANDFPFAISIDQSNNIAVTGTSFYGAPENNNDMVTVLYDSDGNIVWDRRIGSPSGSFDAGFDVVADDVHGVYVVGQSSIDGSTVDFATVRFNTNGDSLWGQLFSGTSGGNDYPKAIAVDASGRCYVTGGGVNTGTAIDITTIHYDTDGSVLWQHDYDSDDLAGDDEASEIAISSTGDVYVAGRAGVHGGKSSRSSDLSSIDAVLIKYDGAGDTAWVRLYNSPNDNSDDFSDMAISPDGNLIAATGGATDATFELDILTCVYTPSGDTAWVRLWDGGSGFSDYGWGVTFARHNEVWVTGYTRGGAFSDSANVVVLRYSSTGELLNSWIHDEEQDRDEGIGIAYNPAGNGAVDIGGIATRSATCCGRDFFAAKLFGEGPALEVTNTNDDGVGSLRAAIEAGNSAPGRDSIAFTTSGTVTLVSALPPIDDFAGALVIDGFTAPGASPGTPTFVLDGHLIGAGHGIEIDSDGNRVQGLEIRDFPGDGIRVNGPARQNRFAANLIFGSGGLDIDLGGDGVTLNDPGDGDAGANDLMNYPNIGAIYLLAGDTFSVSGVAAPLSIVELYVAEKYLGADTTEHPSGSGGSRLFLGSTITTGGGTFNFPALKIPYWSRITATATDVVGNNSEFSPNRLIVPDSLIVTAYSPVFITVITPDSLDSIGPTFNTIGPDATYDQSTDHGLGPDSLPGEPDDQVVITNIQPGDYRIVITKKPGENGDYFLGIRVDGTEQTYQGPGVTGSPDPITNPAPPDGETDDYTFNAERPKRGDFNGDGVLDAQDLNSIIDLLFFGAPPPIPPQLMDINCDGVPDAVDLNYLIDHLFFGGPIPCN